jgi:RNA polymerase sigma-70 factor (ECF subfamily)
VATHLGAFRKRGEADTFRGWLRTIAENKIRDHFRRAGREADAAGGTEAQHRLAQIPAPAAAVDASRDDDWEGPFYRRVLDLVRGEFEERTWQMFWLTVVDDRSPTDVAAQFGVTPVAVRKAKSRVLRRLREEIGDLIE